MKLLDHGYVTLVETWGSDERIIEAARMSTNKGFQGWGPKCVKCGNGPAYAEELGRTQVTGEICPVSNCGGVLVGQGDEKLLHYLYEHKHMTPFEMAGMILEVQAPIFVFREWHRHRTMSYNELSARYTPMPNVVYLPTVERCSQTGTSKQAQRAETFGATTEVSYQEWLDQLAELTRLSEWVYQNGLERGVPKELARLAVTVGRYSRMRASANLRNWLQFLTLRMDPAAQYEIRQYANAVGELIATQFPRTWALFLEKR
jgi:thymidylate synthase (FAD)